MHQTDNVGFGYEKRREGNMNVLNGTESFRYVAFASTRLTLNLNHDTETLSSA